MVLDVAREAQEVARQVAQVEAEITELTRQGAMFRRSGAYCMYSSTRRPLGVSETRHPSNSSADCSVVVQSPEHPEVDGTYARAGCWNNRPLFASGDNRLYWGKTGNWRICTESGDVAANLAVVISASTHDARTPAGVRSWVAWTGLQWVPSRGRVCSDASDATPPLSPWTVVLEDREHAATPCTLAGQLKTMKFETPHFGLCA